LNWVQKLPNGHSQEGPKKGRSKIPFYPKERLEGKSFLKRRLTFIRFSPGIHFRKGEDWFRKPGFQKGSLPRPFQISQGWTSENLWEKVSPKSCPGARKFLGTERFHTDLFKFLRRVRRNP